MIQVTTGKLEFSSLDDALNIDTIKPKDGRKAEIYFSGNAATPKFLLEKLVEITQSGELPKDFANIYGVLPLMNKGDLVNELFLPPVTSSIRPNMFFPGPLVREAINSGRAYYQNKHLSDIADNLINSIRPNVVLLTVNGPDNGGNYSLGTTVEGVLAAVHYAHENGGVVIAEMNHNMPKINGSTIPEKMINFLIESNNPLPISPVKSPDERAKKIGEIIAALYIHNNSCIQYGIGEVPEAVSDAILLKGVKELGIHTELFADAMIRLHQAGIVTNEHKKFDIGISTSSIFLAKDKKGYEWLGDNACVQSKPSEYTNNILIIAQQPNMVSINGAIAVDLNGAVCADMARNRYIINGTGGWVNFNTGAYLSDGGTPIVALKSTTLRRGEEISKIVDSLESGINHTGRSVDPFVIVTEHGAVDKKYLSHGQFALAIAYLAGPTEYRENLLRIIYDSKSPFTHPSKPLKDNEYPKGFIPYADAIKRL